MSERKDDIEIGDSHEVVVEEARPKLKPPSLYRVVFDRHELMTIITGFLKSLVQTEFEFATQHSIFTHPQVSSIVHNNGCWCCCAMPMTCETLVSAISKL